MKTAIAIRHVCFEDLGTLEPLLQTRGYTVRYVDAAVDDLHALDVASPDLMIVLGGPIGAFDDALYPFITAEMALVRQRLDSRRPLLGICLGAQMIARALGARVGSMGVKEIGYVPLTLTPEGEASPLAALGRVPVLHWHGDQFDIPAGAVRLAGTDVCPHQAFALGRHVLALQCHLEADVQQIEHWLVGHACELSQAGLDPRELRTQAHALQPSLSAAAQAVFGDWLDRAETDQPSHAHRMAAPTPDQPLGFGMPDWQPRPLPGPVTLLGSTCRVEPLSAAAHAESLFHAYQQDRQGRDWAYLSVGPFDTLEQYRHHVERITRHQDPLHYAVVDSSTGLAVGTLALMRQQPEHGVIEVGFVSFSPALQRSRMATEAHFLLMSYVFETLRYRRCEWKCDSLNERSRHAAERLGFQPEGVFRQAMIYKGRNRDTAWFAVTDQDWPLLQNAFQAWLDERNFDAQGQQLRRLQCLRESLQS